MAKPQIGNALNWDDQSNVLVDQATIKPEDAEATGEEIGESTFKALMLYVEIERELSRIEAEK